MQAKISSLKREEDLTGATDTFGSMDLEISGIQNQQQSFVSRKYSLNFNNQSGQLDSEATKGSFSLAKMVRKIKLERLSRREDQQSGSSHEEFLRNRVLSSDSDDRALFKE